MIGIDGHVSFLPPKKKKKKKKGQGADRAQPASYRPITLLNTDYNCIVHHAMAKQLPLS